MDGKQVLGGNSVLGRVVRAGDLAALDGCPGLLIETTRAELASHRFAIVGQDVVVRRGDASPWQPIETAPRDGRTILLYRPGAPPWMQVGVGHWKSGRFVDEQREYWLTWMEQILGGAEQYPRRWDATHWMPMPSAPTSSN